MKSVVGDIIDIGQFIKCGICRKRQSTILCDMPIGSIKNLHITKTEKLPDGTNHKSTDMKNSFREITQTCDKEVCSRCAKEVGHDRHICKMCLKKLND